MKNFIIMGIVIIFLAILLALPHPADAIYRISVSQLGNSIKLENLGITDCVIFIQYLGGADERIVLSAGQTEMLFNRPQPIKISTLNK